MATLYQWYSCCRSCHLLFFYDRAVWINLPLSIFAVSLCALCGCVINAFYADCDPISNKQIKKGDQVINVISFLSISLKPLFWDTSIKRTLLLILAGQRLI